MSEFEMNVLRWLAGYDAREPYPGAALNAASEGLRNSGYIDLHGNLTPKGWARINACVPPCDRA